MWALATGATSELTSLCSSGGTKNDCTMSPTAMMSIRIEHAVHCFAPLIVFGLIFFAIAAVHSPLRCVQVKQQLPQLRLTPTATGMRSEPSSPTEEYDLAILHSCCVHCLRCWRAVSVCRSTPIWADRIGSTRLSSAQLQLSLF